MATKNLRQASADATSKMILQNDGAIDLAKVQGGAEALSKGLQSAFMATILPLIDEVPVSTGNAAPIMRALAERVAALEADLFLIKSCLSGQHRFIAGDADNYQDPIAALRMLGANAPGILDMGPGAEINLHLGREVLGHGWHEIESRGENRFWRWSGPGKQSTLVLPCLGPGSYQIEWNFEVLDRAVVDPLSISINSKQVDELKINWRNRNTGTVIVKATIPENYRTGYVFLAFEIAAVLRPSEMGSSNDQRPLGLGMSDIKLTRE